MLETFVHITEDEINSKNLLTISEKEYIIYNVANGYGSIAQLGEHLPYKQRVIGSSPIVPTIVAW